MLNSDNAHADNVHAYPCKDCPVILAYLEDARVFLSSASHLLLAIFYIVYIRKVSRFKRNTFQ